MLLPIVRFIVVGIFLGVCSSAEEFKREISDIHWTLGPNHPEFRKGGCLTALENKIISVFGMRQPWGEMASMYIYDPAKTNWFRGPDGPLGQTYLEGTECGSSFFAIGGRSGQEGGVHRRCFRMDLKNGQFRWTELPMLNEPRGWAPSVCVGSKLYVFGGSKGARSTTLKSIEELDLSRNEATWKKIGELPAGSRGWSSAATVRGKIYVFGGIEIEKESDRKNDLWQFDPSTMQWRQKRDMPFRVSGLDSVVYKDRYIIAAGGYAMTEDFNAEMKTAAQKDRFHPYHYNPFVLVYDVVSENWHQLPGLLPMPTNDIRMAILDDKIYALGGENNEPATSNTTPWLRIGEIIFNK